LLAPSSSINHLTPHIMKSVIFVSCILFLFLFNLSSSSLILPSSSSLSESVSVSDARQPGINVCNAFTSWSFCPGSPTNLVNLADFTILVCPPYLMAGWSFSLAETQRNFLVSVVGNQPVVGEFYNIQTADSMTVNSVPVFLANTSYYFVVRDLTIGLPTGTYEANQVWTDPLGKPFMCIHYLFKI